MSFIIKNVRTLNILRHALYSKHLLNSSCKINILQRKSLIIRNVTLLSRSIMTQAAVKSIGVVELRKYQKDGTLIIDVREPKEIAETGVLPGGINIPLAQIGEALSKSPSDFEKQYGKKKPEKSNDIVFSCRSGKRSAMASQKAAELGFLKVHNFEGGWLEWEKSGKS